MAKQMLLQRREAIKALLAISATGALAACGQGDAKAPRPKGERRETELSAGSMGLLVAIVDTIIPDTDTGGAVAAGVPAVLQSLVKDWGDDTFKAYWTGGMHAIGKTLDRLAGQKFVELSPKLRASLLNKYDAEVYSGEIEDAFYKDMKRTAATAYYMSEIGASEELAYEAVPGEWIGCVELADFPKSWAT